MKATLLVLLLACFVAFVSAGCDSWCVAEAGHSLLDCTSAAGTNFTAQCECRLAEMTAIKDCHDCFVDSAYYVFHYDCLAFGCSTYYCNSATSLAVSLVAALIAIFATLL